MKISKILTIICLIATLLVAETVQAADSISDTSNQSASTTVKDKQVVSTVTYTEFEIIEKLSLYSVQELEAAGYSSSEIQMIKDDNLKETYVKEIMKRAKLSVQELRDMGYSDVQIDKFKSLTGNETLEEIIRSEILAKLDISASIVQHYYKSAVNKTYVIAEYTWEWSQVPTYTLEDGIGIGWNQEFAIENAISNISNKHKITYVSRTNSSNSYSVTYDMEEDEMNTSYAKFSLRGNTNYYAKRGSGIVELSQVGEVYNVKFVAKYGHNMVQSSISITYPWGIGFTFVNVEESYTSKVKNSQTPIEI